MSVVEGRNLDPEIDDILSTVQKRMAEPDRAEAIEQMIASMHEIQGYINPAIGGAQKDTIRVVMLLYYMMLEREARRSREIKFVHQTKPPCEIADRLLPSEVITQDETEGLNS